MKGIARETLQDGYPTINLDNTRQELPDATGAPADDWNSGARTDVAYLNGAEALGGNVTDARSLSTNIPEDLGDSDITSLFDLLNTVAANFPQRSSSTGKSTINKMLTGDGLSGGGRIKQFEFKASFTDTDGSPLSGAFRYVATDKAGLVPRRPDKGSRKAFETFARHG